jgi:hypothetical protein
MNICTIWYLYSDGFFSSDGGVGLVPKRGCLLILYYMPAYYAFPR